MSDSSLRSKLEAFKVIPVIVVESVADALQLGTILVEEGLPVAEITFRSAAASDAIAALKNTHPELCLCAGTILNQAQVVAAKKAGADFLVSPGFNPLTLAAAKKHNITLIPGVNNPMAIEAALNEGLTLLKFFPAEASGGINMVKSLLAPYRDIALMPTGGIDIGNIRDYLNIDRVIACGASWMVDPKLMKAQNWDKVRQRIRTIKGIAQN